MRKFQDKPAAKTAVTPTAAPVPVAVAATSTEATAKTTSPPGTHQLDRSSSSKITRLAGATTSTTHSMDEEEKIEFTSHINAALGKDAMLKDRLPFSVNDNSLFEGCRDGLVLRYILE